jgi:hypothetical protein
VISASDSAADVAQRVEAQAGLPRGGRLLLNGVELAGGSLASYGVRPGAVLELLPHEPGAAAPPLPGSPLLSSPQHELACPRRLRAGRGVFRGFGCHGSGVVGTLLHVPAAGRCTVGM